MAEKRAKLQCQIRHYLERGLPGDAALFPEDDLWTRPAPIFLPRQAGSGAALREAGVPGATRWRKKAQLRLHARTVHADRRLVGQVQ